MTPGYFQCDNYLRPVFTLTHVQFVNRTFAVMSLLIMGAALILTLIGMGTVQNDVIDKNYSTYLEIAVHK